MTEAEELEFLRLKKRKAMSLAGKPRGQMEPPPVPDDIDPYRQLEDPPLPQEEYAGKQVNVAESFGAGALDDMTFGGSDELSGVLGAAVEQGGRAARAVGLAEPLPRVGYGGDQRSQVLTKKLRGPDGRMRLVGREVRAAPAPLEAEDPEQTVGQSYRGNRDRLREYMRLAEAQNPKSFTTGGFAGSAAMAPLALTPGGMSVKSLAAGGGLMGLMGSDADLTTANAENFKDAATSAAFGAGAGIVFGKGGEYAGKKIAGSRFGKWFEKKAGDVGEAIKDRFSKKGAKEAAEEAGEAVADEAGEILPETAIKILPPGNPPPPGPGVTRVPGDSPEALAKLGKRGGVTPVNPVPGQPPPGATGGAAGKRKIPLDPEDIDDEMISDFVNQHADKAESLIQKLGLDLPDAEGWFYRDVDITPAQRHRLYKKGVDERAAQEILGHPRYPAAKTLPQKKELVAERLAEQNAKKSAALQAFDSIAEPEELLDPSVVVARVEQEILAPLRRGTLGDRAAAKRVEEELQALIERVPGEGYGMGLADAADYLQSLDRHLYKNKGDPDDVAFAKKTLQRVRGIFNNELEQKVDAIAKRIGQPEAFGNWKDAKRSVGALTELLGPVEQRMSARESNRWLSLTDNIIGSGVGSALGGASGLFDDEPTYPEAAMRTGAGFVLGGLANKWGRERLPHVMAQRAWRKRLQQLLRASK